MSQHFNTWQFIGGLGLFLFAMLQLEEALKAFAGARFRRLLKSYTAHPIQAATTGAVATAFLQSSSLVGLMVLAFVGAGLMPLKSALGVIFGSNFGTTLTGWFVASAGFRLDLDAASLPLLGLGCIVFVMGRGKVAHIGRLAAALGFLLLGLVWMKDSAGSFTDAIDVQRLAGYGGWQYLLFGMIFAGVVQSSSATMMVTLTALNADIINLPSAAAIAIGADLGTTTTVILGSVKGVVAKKRVALAHVVFNVVTDALAFGLRLPLLAGIAAAGIHDPLFALVAFHSLFNLLGVALFLPFTAPFARFLEARFRAPDSAASRFVSQLQPTDTGAALAAIQEETAHLIARVVEQNRQVFARTLPRPAGHLPVEFDLSTLVHGVGFEDDYRQTKRLEGEILDFAMRLQLQSLSAHESARLVRLQNAVRDAVHSSKSLNDIRLDVEQFEASDRSAVNAYLGRFRDEMAGFYAQLFQLRRDGGSHGLFEALSNLVHYAQGLHDHLYESIHKDISRKAIDVSDTSPLLNVNREILTSALSLLLALANFQLSESEAQAVAQLPGMR